MWDPLEEQWKETYQRLAAFQKEHNSTIVPIEYDADPELGEWVSTQRKVYGEFANIEDAEALKEAISHAFNYTSAGQSKISLIVSRVARLNGIGFVWDPVGKQVRENYGKLLAYVKEFDSVLVPQKYEADPGFGRWISTQRESYLSLIHI